MSCYDGYMDALHYWNSGPKARAVRAVKTATGCGPLEARQLVDLVLITADDHWYPDSSGCIVRHDKPHERNSR